MRLNSDDLQQKWVESLFFIYHSGAPRSHWGPSLIVGPPSRYPQNTFQKVRCGMRCRIRSDPTVRIGNSAWKFPDRIKRIWKISGSDLDRIAIFRIGLTFFGLDRTYRYWKKSCSNSTVMWSSRTPADLIMVPV